MLSPAQNFEKKKTFRAIAKEKKIIEKTSHLLIYMNKSQEKKTLQSSIY